MLKMDKENNDKMEFSLIFIIYCLFPYNIAECSKLVLLISTFMDASFIIRIISHKGEYKRAIAHNNNCLVKVS